MELHVRAARPDDAAAIAAIHAEGIADGDATFDPDPVAVPDLEARLEAAEQPWLVAERDGRIVGWAGLWPYSTRPVYDGVAECSVYVARGARGTGVGAHLLDELFEAAERAERYKLIGKIFPENQASLRLFERSGFREVGVHHRHGRLDGRWRDVVVLEKLLGPAADPGQRPGARPEPY
jgi:L-amino acid N-acyltransferase YncA